MKDYNFREGDWILVDLGNRKFKGYIFEKGVYKSVVNVFVPKANIYSPHCYHNDQITLLPLDTFENEKELYVDGALLLGCKNTFMEVMQDETIK